MGIMFSPSWRGDTIELELKTKVYDMAYKIRVSRTLKNSARARWPAFKFQLGHLLVVCPWTNYLLFSIFKYRIKAEPTELICVGCFDSW